MNDLSAPKTASALAERRFKNRQNAVLVLAGLLLIACISFGVQFLRSYVELREAIQRERVSYVQEISEQIINSQRFMKQEYSTEVLNYAAMINRAQPQSIGETKACFGSATAGQLLLVGKAGNLVDLNGKALLLPDRQLIKNLPVQGQVAQLFTSLNYVDDYWLFSTYIRPLLLDGEEYNAICLSIPADQFRANLSISLFEGRGASYIINNDGSIKIKPQDAELAFDGYNLLTGMLVLGADQADIDQLHADLQMLATGSMLLDIQGEDWMISHSSIDEDISILVAVPLSITAASTYDGLSDSVGFAAVTVASLALTTITLLIFFFNRDQKRRREAMAVAAKSDFFSKMSHDIRTPLNAVIGLELLARDISDNTQVKDYLNQSSAAATYLLSIINDVLDMGHIESGKLTLTNEPFAPDKLLDDICSVIEPLSRDREQDFILEQETPFDSAYIGDQVRLKQILMNLLSNAVKFTRSGGWVRLRVQRQPHREGWDMLVFSISDNGVGISKDYLGRIFSPFEQEHPSYTGQNAGSGLGLAIVHNLVTMMGGTVSVDSQTGRGTTFIVSLPLQRGQLPQPAPQPPEAGRRKPGLVLLAEDNRINQQVAEAILSKKFGLRSEVADNGRLALEMFIAAPLYHYDLILMDVKMPLMDGLEATRRIRALQREDAATIPIIALSANAFDEDVALSLQAGMNAHLGKPIDVAVLGAVLDKYLKIEEDLQ